MSDNFNKWARIADRIDLVTVQVAVLTAIAMLVSRFFPSEGVFPSHDSYFFYFAAVQAAMTFIVFGVKAISVMAGARMTYVPYQIALAPTSVALLSLPHVEIFGTFIALAALTWAFLYVTGRDIQAFDADDQNLVQSLRSRQIDRMRAKLQKGDPDSGQGENPQSQVILYPATMPSTAFKDIVGMKKVKAELLEAGQEIIAGASEVGQLRNGILLYGEPGNGKTFFVEALAGELKLPMITATFGDVVSKYVGDTPDRVAQAFRDARAQAPCLLFIDEIDSLIRDREKTINSTAEDAKITNVILTEIVRTRSSKVVIVAATNFINKLDAAATREGRFDFKIELPPPDEIARYALIRSTFASYLDLNVTDEAVSLASKRWEGFSVARIRAVTDEVCRNAVKNNVEVVEYTDFQSALRKVQGRAGKMPADTPLLSALTLPKPLADRLHGLARRMKQIEHAEALGGKMPTGLLFMGPPGTGKTVTARALAKTAGWAFVSTTGSELIAQPDRIDEIVREAKDIRPTIVFLDEADDVLADRQFASHTAAVTNRLLTAMDGAGGRTTDIIWIAATNHPDQIDPAALRGGRFTVKLEFEVPDAPTVKTYAQKWIAQSNATFAKDATPGAIADLLVGLSIANISAVLQQAADLAVDRALASDVTHGGRLPREAVTLKDVRAALNLVIA